MEQVYNAQSSTLRLDLSCSKPLFEAEMHGVFGRSWLFAAPLNLVSEPGQYVTAQTAAGEVILWRGADLELHAYSNICPTGFTRIARAARGRATRLACACHGTVFSADGFAVYAGEIKLAPVNLQIWRGLIFIGPQDRSAGSSSFSGLDWCMELWGHDLVADDEPPLGWRVDANWKFVAEHFMSDPYPTGMSFPDRTPGEDGAQLSLVEGTAIFVRKALSEQCFAAPQADNWLILRRLGIFPNTRVDFDLGVLQTLTPIGTAETLVTSYLLRRDGEDIDVLDRRRRQHRLFFGPTGTISCDEAGVWRSATQNALAQSAGPRPLTLAAGLTAERSGNMPGRQGPMHGDLIARSFYGWVQQHLGPMGNSDQ